MTIKYNIFQTSDTVNLNPLVFDKEVNSQEVKSVVRWQLAKHRQGSHSTLNRSSMKGGGRKPHKQKGTGRARAGSNNSPLFRGGAVIHGPSPRDYSFKLNKNTKINALCSVLSQKRRQEKLVVVKDIELKDHKTSSLCSLLSTLDVKKCLFIIPQNDNFSYPEKYSSEEEQVFNNIKIASANLKDVDFLAENFLNVYYLLKFDTIIIPVKVLEDLEQRLEKRVNG